MSACPFANGGSGATEGVHGEEGTADKKLTYHDYLQLEKILGAQQKKSDVDDEHLFIIIHQAYELWFKQINYEIDVALKVFMESTTVDSGKLLDIINRFKRIVQILKLCTSQIDILETMTPFDFLQFRGYLFPASGFQSWQFRIMENKLGLKESDRFPYGKSETYKVAFEDQPENTNKINTSEQETSLFRCLDKWLTSLLDTQKSHFDFETKYKEGVNEMLEEKLKDVEAVTDEEQRNDSMDSYETTKKMFNSVIDESLHNKRLNLTKDRKFSHRAMLGALMVFMYSGEQAFNLPHQFLHLLMDIDTWIAKWRFSHMILVKRMIGQLAGTGGSTGYEYLKGTVGHESNTVFVDLFNMSSFLLPQKFIKPFTNAEN